MISSMSQLLQFPVDIAMGDDCRPNDRVLGSAIYINISQLPVALGVAEHSQVRAIFKLGGG